ncbi:MAG: aminoacyl-tRNA hydrolase [Anaerolineaceae bacterium]|nr:aminoacyl-tRNA hydrolase [Anaerolineaceae bacterium]
MRLVVGLGNPGKQYQATRHNLGFRVVDVLRDRLGEVSTKERFASLVTEAGGPAFAGRSRYGGRRPGHKVLLLQPQTFMNLSGRAVAEAVRFYKLDLSSVLVVCDDFNLPLGRLRFRPSGSHGGHNGLRSIIELLADDEFSRLRMGIGPLGGEDAVSFCLKKFRPAEIEDVEKMILTAAEAVMVWLEKGIDEAMNRFNASPGE